MVKLAKLKNDLNSKKYPDDKIKFILFKYDKEYIPKNPNIIHNSFYNLIRSNRNYYEVLKEFIFDTSGIYPYSKLLNSILYRLEISKYLLVDNFNSDRYRIKQDIDSENLFEKFNKDEIDILADISQELFVGGFKMEIPEKTLKRFKELYKKKEEIKDANLKYTRQYNKMMEETGEDNYEVPFDRIELNERNKNLLKDL